MIRSATSLQDTGQQTTEALTDANTKIGTAGQTMTDLAAQLQGDSGNPASEDGTISAAALNDVINALNSVAGGMTGVDGSYMSSYSDQVSQLAAGVSGSALFYSGKSECCCFQA